jgi:type III pantothenate kinase
MILELDCGNSLIKWRVLQAGSGDVAAQGASASVAELLDVLAGSAVSNIARARLVSVRSDAETADLCSRLSGTLQIDVQQAAPSARLGGVVNGYVDYSRLGLDRWLAIVGAFQMKPGAMLVLDLGTAITVDFVDGHGMHLGGYICPGASLLRQQLHSHTRRINYEMEEATAARCAYAPGRRTVEAVERVCYLMLRTFVSSQIQQASTYLGADFSIYSTGGDAALIDDIAQIQYVPDLVFRGLAVACP